MVKSAAIDTSVAIRILNNDKVLVKIFTRIPTLYLPVTVEGELLFGALNSERHIKNLKTFKAFIDTCAILNINSEIAKEYAVLRKQLKDSGTPIPENDIWIAATCLVYQLPLATLDKHFSFIKKLSLVKL